MSERTFYASVYSVETGEERNLATFYLMNTTVNRNGWGVTDKALEEALTTILRKPIGYGPEYKIDQHYPEPMKGGKFIRSEKPDGYALGTAEITDPMVWDYLTSGEWGPISVVILSFRESCSSCGEDLTGSENPFNHSCIVDRKGYLIVESFVFDRVDFIDVPAYPQAGYISQVQQQVSLELLAGFYEGESRSNGQASESPGDPNLTDKKRKNMSETEQQQEQKLKEQLEELESRNKELAETNETLEIKMALLEQQMAEIHEAEHMRLVEEVLEARIKAELVDNTSEEKEYLAAKSETELEDIKRDAFKMISKLEAIKGKPKAKYTETDGSQLKAAMEEARIRLFGPKEEV
jgi:hypothetical protein